MWLKINAVFILPHIMTQSWCFVISMKSRNLHEDTSLHFPSGLHRDVVQHSEAPPPTCMQLFTLEFVSVVMTTLNLMLFTGDSIMTWVAARPGSQSVRGKLNRHLDWVLGRYNDKLIYSIVYTPYSKGNKAFVSHHTPIFANAGSAEFKFVWSLPPEKLHNFKLLVIAH